MSKMKELWYAKQQSEEEFKMKLQELKYKQRLKNIKNNLKGELDGKQPERVK